MSKDNGSHLVHSGASPETTTLLGLDAGARSHNSSGFGDFDESSNTASITNQDEAASVNEVVAKSTLIYVDVTEESREGQEPWPNSCCSSSSGSSNLCNEVLEDEADQSEAAGAIDRRTDCFEFDFDDIIKELDLTRPQEMPAPATEQSQEQVEEEINKEDADDLQEDINILLKAMATHSSGGGSSKADFMRADKCAQQSGFIQNTSSETAKAMEENTKIKFPKKNLATVAEQSQEQLDEEIHKEDADDLQENITILLKAMATHSSRGGSSKEDCMRADEIARQSGFIQSTSSKKAEAMEVNTRMKSATKNLATVAEQSQEQLEEKIHKEDADDLQEDINILLKAMATHNSGGGSSKEDFLRADEFARQSGFIQSTSSKTAEAMEENAKMKFTKENLHNKFFIVCDSLGEEAVQMPSVNSDSDDIWTGLRRSLLSNCHTLIPKNTNRMMTSSGDEVHLYDIKDQIKEMVHTKPLVHFRVQAMHTCQLEDLYKRVMRNKVYRCPQLLAQTSSKPSINPLLHQNRTMQHGRI